MYYIVVIPAEQNVKVENGICFSFTRAKYNEWHQRGNLQITPTLPLPTM